MSKRELEGDTIAADQEEVDRLRAEMDAEDEADTDGDGDREDRFSWDDNQVVVNPTKKPRDPQPE